MPVTIDALSEQDLDRLAPLWLKLRDYHADLSVHAGQAIAGVTWSHRREGLLKKASGRLHLDVARDGGTLVGYCITSIDGENTGEIESIWLESAYRGRGTGGRFMERALAWLDERRVQRRVLGIAAGNEAVTGFYRRFGFEVRTVIMEQVRPTDS